MENFEERKVTQYLVPANVTTKFEFFEGFGWYEFKIVLITCLIGGIFFFLLGLPQKNVPVTVPVAIQMEDSLPQTSMEIQNRSEPYIPTLIRLLFVIVPAAASFFIVKRDPSSGMSLISVIKSQQQYSKRQKRYLNVYGSGSEVKNV